MKGYYAAMYEHDSKDLESMKQVYKDIRKVKSQVRQIFNFISKIVLSVPSTDAGTLGDPVGGFGSPIIPRMAIIFDDVS